MSKNKQFIIGIDASRNRSGGAKAHIIGILTSINPQNFNIDIIHIWSYKGLLNEIPNFDWIIKHNPDELEENLVTQVYWQKFKLPNELKVNKCNVLLSTDAGTFCRFTPSVVMSRDMLSFEENEMNRYKGTFFWLRLLILKYIQISSLKKSTGALFLTNYAAQIIYKNKKIKKDYRIIPHGISENFSFPSKVSRWKNKKDYIKCVYVSNADLYKHQWNVLKAFKILNNKGYNAHINFVGAKSGRKSAIAKLEKARDLYDLDSDFSKFTDFISHKQMPDFLNNADIFIFASSCENMPNTLIEGMAAGLPICSSNRGPMPEILTDKGIYFDPEDIDSIVDSLQKMFDSPNMCTELAKKSKEISKQFSWERCATETFKYLNDITNKK